MKEQIVSLRVAEFLKEKGFNWQIDLAYWEDDALHLNSSDNSKDFLTSAPSQSVVQRWLREVHQLHVVLVKRPSGWCWIIRNLNSDFYNGELKGVAYSTKGSYNFENALEEALQKALELI